MLSVPLLDQVYRLAALFSQLFLRFFVVLFWVCFSEFLGAFEGVPGVFYSTFSLKNVNLRISEIPLKAWHAQCFSRSRHPGGREKVIKKVLSGFFVKFLGGAPGSLLGAFWMPFGCPLGALGTSLGDFGSALAALVGRFAEVVPPRLGQLWQPWWVALQRLSLPVPPCPTISHHIPPR